MKLELNEGKALLLIDKPSKIETDFMLTINGEKLDKNKIYEVGEYKIESDSDEIELELKHETNDLDGLLNFVNQELDKRDKVLDGKLIILKEEVKSELFDLVKELKEGFKMLNSKIENVLNDTVNNETLRLKNERNMLHNKLVTAEDYIDHLKGIIDNYGIEN